MPGYYISYPFCNQKCTFCNFASGVSAPPTIAAYHAALLTQLRHEPAPWPIETLYFGGGTPSLMPIEFLCDIMDAIPVSHLREATMEAAPGTLTSQKLAAWRALGINRVSLGAQSFITEELRQTGRRHTAETVAADVALLAAAGITNVNIDLIAGLPNQSRESFLKSLACIKRLNASHVSVYTFEVDEDSRLGKEVLLGGNRYGASNIPSDDLIADLYELAVTELTAQGIPRYEISNFARPGFESVHNLKYWRLESYLGFGLDAHSHLDSRRFSTSDDLVQYLANPLKRFDDQASDPAEEHFFIGLRLDSGIEPTLEEWNRFAEPIAHWTAAGMLTREGPRLRLSKAGALVSNEIFQDFLTTQHA